MNRTGRSAKRRKAAAAYRAALERDPGNPALRYQLACALIDLEDYEAAQAELERLRERGPELPHAHYSLAHVQRQLGRIREAIASYRRAAELRPLHADTQSSLALTLNYSADCQPQEIFEEHRRFGERHAEPAVPPAPDPSWPRRLRVGYVSPDFRSHVVSSFMLPILARHDRKRFEVFCYFTHPEADSVTAGLRMLADRWAECGGQSDADLARRIRADRIDLLVDLAGHMAWRRLRVFALRPAPLQLTYLGYPNTTGLAAIDYRISDAIADPPGESERWHTERLARLPGPFLCYRPGPEIHALTPPPAQRAGSPTFGCFSNFQKLSDPFFDAAARILAALPGSRLLLKARPLAFASVARAVRSRFEGAGIEPARLVLRGWEPAVERHLAAYQEVDVALDSFPYNGTTTTCEALWMGVPVVTLAGSRHAARVGASLLGAVGLGELVARDADGYVRTAVALAGDVARLAALRQGMRTRMRRSPLMDERGFVQGLEQCYLDLWQAKLRESARRAPLGQERTAQLLASAREHRAEGRPQEAIAACREILGGRPDHEEALTLLWDVAHESQQRDLALHALAAAIAANGAVARFHYMLGCTLQELVRFVEAMDAYRRALELDPGLAKAANNLGCLLEQHGALRQAARCYEDALRADPGLAQSRANLESLRRRLTRSAAPPPG